MMPTEWTHMLEQVLLIEDILTEKQLVSLQDMVQHYKEFQEELYNYPPEDTLFTKSQLELFQIFDVR